MAAFGNVGIKFKVANLRFCKNDNDDIILGSMNYKLGLVEQAISGLNLSTSEKFDTSLKFGIIVAPEYFWGKKATLRRTDHDYIIEKLKALAKLNVRILFVVGTISYYVSDQIDPTQKKFEVRNVAPIIYHQYNQYGILQLEEQMYEKVNAFNEVYDQGTQYFVPGPPFTYSYPWKVGSGSSGRVLNFSVEICMDHASAAACTAIQTNAQQNVFMLHPSILSLGESKDFSIVVSDFCENLELNKIYEMVRKPSNFIHSSTVFRYKKDCISNFVDIMSPCFYYHLPNHKIEDLNVDAGEKRIVFRASIWHYHDMQV
eukprot:gene31347-40730_t